jgi:hypothetical protein
MSWLRKGLANSGSCFVPARRAGPQVEKLSPFGTLIHARPPETTIDSLDTSSCLRLVADIRGKRDDWRLVSQCGLSNPRSECPSAVAQG